jgi:prevent-host-death family protein
MVSVNIHAAKTHLSRLVERAAAGEEIVIARAGKPVAKLVPLEPTRLTPRRSGGMAGELWLADDFDAPMPPEVWGAFEGEDDPV